MTAILFVAILVLGVLLYDARKRLASLEARFRQLDAPAVEEYRPAVIITDQPVAPSRVEAEQAVLPRPTVEKAPSIWAGAQEEGLFTEPEPSSQPPPVPRVEKPSGSGFEDLFGRKLPIWAGGITLVVAAILLVKYSIDANLLSPVVRVVIGIVFGAGLIGGAGIARRRADLVQDERIAQALAGAGVGSLYAATLAAANLYGLIGSGVAFAALGIITALALGLSIRFGAPTAVLGLIGGLAAPALVSSVAPNVPLLAAYLALVTGGITLLSRSQRWFWLGVSALAGGGAWSAIMILLGGLDGSSSLSVGLLIVILGLALPMMASADRRNPMLQGVAALVSALQLAALVATGGYTMLNWGLYALLSTALIWLTTRVATLRLTVAVPLIASMILAATWPNPSAALFTMVMIGIVAIFVGSALWRLWRMDGMTFDAGQIVLTALGGFGATYWQFGSASSGDALIALAFALLPAAGAALGWPHAERRQHMRFAMLSPAAGLLVIIAATLALPLWTVPISIALVAAILLELGVKAGPKVRQGALAFIALATVALLGTGGAAGEISRLVTTTPLEAPVQAIVRWSALLVTAALFAWRLSGSRTGMVVQGLAAILCYGLIAQVVPAQWLAIAAALGMLAAAEVQRSKPALDLRVAAAVLAAIAALWALEPLARWLFAGMAALTGDPMFVGDLPDRWSALRQMLVPASIGATALWRVRDGLPAMARTVAFAQMGVIGLIGAHILYKQLFAIGDMAAFIAHGLAERTLWEVTLGAIGTALARKWREAAILVGLGLAHNLYFSLLLHDPLWAVQAVGPWPLVNLLLPAFGIAYAGPSLVAKLMPEWRPHLPVPAAILHMVVLALVAVASMRQIFCGSIIAHIALGPTENILLSVLCIALGVGYLLWGIRSGQRSWRIGSLLLMLGAVMKVFLFDASGLEGLLRIGSFLALGFSLIGIGWLYSRYLKPDAAA
ncbi:MAG: DUF2339 domain-containing protein [Sphingobium sp.]